MGSFQAKMASSSQDDFTPLSQLTVGNRRCRARVRVSRMWVASNPNTGDKYGLHCLLIDDEGVTMQAHTHRDNIERFQQKLVEGKVYALSDFVVHERMEHYMACSNGLMMLMEEHTVVNEIEEGTTGSSIPLHSFKFVDFDDVPCRNGQKSLFTDVIGQIVSIEDMGQIWKWDIWCNKTFRNTRLRDLRGRELIIVLYGDLGSNFEAEKVLKQGRQAPIIAVFAGIKGFIVRDSSASKYYLDLDIPEVQEFRASLHDGNIPITHLPCQQQYPANPAEVLVNCWRTIEQLRSLNPYEVHNTKYLCRATLKGIDMTQRWWYQSCFHCKRSICGDRSRFWRINGCPVNRSPILRYKLDAIIEDATGTMNIMIYDEQARKLVGVEAEALVKETENEDDGSGCMDSISAVVGSGWARAFVVSLENGSAVVKCILDDDALQLNGLVQMEAGGGDHLSQAKSSCASCSWS
ncbi:hypothetical protein ACP4OV_022336 [Aristida adscensionis]